MPTDYTTMGDEVFRAQFALIVAATARRQDGVEVAAEPYMRSDVHFQYAVGRMLIRTDVFNSQVRYENEDMQVRELIERLVPGVQVRESPDRMSQITVLSSGDLEVPEALDRLDPELGVGTVTPDHLLSITSGGSVSNCPATEPDPIPGFGPYPPQVAGGAGTGVHIAIPDRGLVERPPNTTHTWLTGVDGDPDPNVKPGTPAMGGTPGTPAMLGEYAAHGTFCAGVARCAAPGATVTVTDAFRFAGADLESFVFANLTAALELQPNIISLSAGGYTRADQPLLTAQVFAERLQEVENHGTILVAAAGNDGTKRPFFPAADEQVFGVGALAFDQLSRAWFSNYGDWVDIWALGDGMINAFAEGRYTYAEPPRKGSSVNFAGMARWSGTSFSTPLFAGLVAARMSRAAAAGQPETSRQAAEALIAFAANQMVAGAGPALRFDQAP